MKRILCLAAILLPVFGPTAADLGPAPVGDSAARNDQRLADYFRAQTAVLSEHCLSDIRSLEDWEARRGE